MPNVTLATAAPFSPASLFGALSSPLATLLAQPDRVVMLNASCAEDIVSPTANATRCDVTLCDPWSGFQRLGSSVWLATATPAPSSPVATPAPWNSSSSSGTSGRRQVLFGSLERPLALCGHLGNATRGVTLLVHVFASSASLSLLGTAAWLAELRPGVPVFAHVPHASPFCQGGFYLRAHVPAPALTLQLLDAWGNPAQLVTSGFTLARISASMHSGGDTASVAAVVVVFEGQTSVADGDSSLTFARLVPKIATLPAAAVLSLEGLGSIVLDGHSAGCQKVRVEPGFAQSIDLVAQPKQAVEPVNASLWLVAMEHDVAFTTQGRDASGSHVLRAPREAQISCRAQLRNGTAVAVVDATTTSSGIDASMWSLASRGLDAGAEMTITCTANGHQPTPSSATVHVKVVPNGETNCYRPVFRAADPKAAAMAFAAVLRADAAAVAAAVMSIPQATTIIPFTQLTIVPAPSEPSAARSHRRSTDTAQDGLAGQYLDLPADYAQWILVPDQQYLNIPLGLLRALAFGSSYSTLTRVMLELRLPVCRSAHLEALRENVALWMYSAGFNATNILIKSIESTAFSQKINVCSGSGLASLEFVNLVCCDSLAL